VDLLPFSPDAVWYSTPSFGGFMANVAYGSSEGGSTGAFTAAKNNQLSLVYAAGPLYVTYAYDNVENTTAASLNNNITTQLIGATYNFGAAKLFANYGTQKNAANTSTQAYVSNGETNVGVSVPMGAVTFLASLGRNTRTTIDAAGAETAASTGSGNDWALAGTYALSARTHGYVKAASTGNYTFGGTQNSASINFTAIGIRHIF